MNNFLNSKFLNDSIFMADVSELKIPNEEIIYNIINNLENKDYSLLYLLKLVSTLNIFLLEQHMNFEIISNYYKLLFKEFCDLLNKKYDEKILNMLITYVLKDEYRDNKRGQLIIDIENILYDDELNNFLADDEYWYILESLKYFLLNLYTTYKTQDNIIKLRPIIADVQQNKEKYDTISLINYYK